MSNEVVTVEWIGEERTVPYSAPFVKGEKYTLPTAQAQQYINEGVAKAVKPSRSRSQED